MKKFLIMLTSIPLLGLLFVVEYSIRHKQYVRARNVVRT
jgi:hypothetical protein